MTKRLVSPELVWQCDQTMERILLLVGVDPTGNKIQPDSLKDLKWPGWIKTIREFPITSWKSDTLDGQEFAGSF